MSKEFKTIYLKIESEAELNLLYSAMSVGVTEHARKFNPDFSEDEIKDMFREEYDLYEKIQDIVFELKYGLEQGEE